MTPKIMASTNQAAPVCEPKKRERRFSRAGRVLDPDDHEDQQGDEDGHREEVLEEADRPAVWPISGMWKSRWNRQPYASMMVRNRMVKPQKVKAWARPGHRPLQQLLLAAHLDQLGLDPLGDVLEAGGDGGLAGGDEPEEPEEPAAGDGEHHRGDTETYGKSEGHCIPPRWLLQSNKAGQLRDLGRSDGHGRKLSAYRLGVGPHWPWYFDLSPSEPYGMVGRRWSSAGS